MSSLFFVCVFAYAKLAAVCRCGLTVSARQAETTPSLLAMLPVIQPWMLMAISAAQAHCQLLPSSLPSGPPGPFLQSCSCLSACIIARIYSFPTPGLVFTKFHKVPVGLFLQPLKGSPTFQHTGCSPQFDVLCKPDGNALSKSRRSECWKLSSYLSPSTSPSHFVSP